MGSPAELRAVALSTAVEHAQLRPVARLPALCVASRNRRGLLSQTSHPDEPVASSMSLV